MRALHVTDLVANVEVTAAFLQLFGLCKAVVSCCCGELYGLPAKWAESFLRFECLCTGVLFACSGL
jgi:hypothetical protein